jgi:hypothetical protein
MSAFGFAQQRAAADEHVHRPGGGLGLLHAAAAWNLCQPAGGQIPHQVPHRRFGHDAGHLPAWIVLTDLRNKNLYSEEDVVTIPAAVCLC